MSENSILLAQDHCSVVVSESGCEARVRRFESWSGPILFAGYVVSDCFFFTWGCVSQNKQLKQLEVVEEARIRTRELPSHKRKL